MKNDNHFQVQFPLPNVSESLVLGFISLSQKCDCWMDKESSSRGFLLPPDWRLSPSPLLPSVLHCSLLASSLHHASLFPVQHIRFSLTLRAGHVAPYFLNRLICLSLFGHASLKLLQVRSLLQHVGSSSPNRDQTQLPCIGDDESQPLDCHGSPSLDIQKQPSHFCLRQI